MESIMTTNSETFQREANPEEQPEEKPDRVLINTSDELSEEEIIPSDLNIMPTQHNKSNKRKKRPANWYIGTFEDAAPFQKDNECLLTGYRINFNSVGKILRSLFMLHNDTMNVWTHLLSVFFCISCIIYTAIWISPKIQYPSLSHIQAKLHNISSSFERLSIPDSIGLLNQTAGTSENAINEKIEKSIQDIYLKISQLKQ